MSRCPRRPGLTIWPTLLVLLWAAGCARPDRIGSSDRTAQSDHHQVPFREGSQNNATADTSDVAQNDPKSATGLPFHDSENLPAGTLLTVRLTSQLAADPKGINGTFEAVIDSPVVSDGNTLLPRGTAVAGRVESAAASNVKSNRGYVRLALNSIHVAGAELPIQTSSLFARADVATPRNLEPVTSTNVVRLEKGRRLTFRLTGPVYVANRRESLTP